MSDTSNEYESTIQENANLFIYEIPAAIKKLITLFTYPEEGNKSFI